MEKSPIQSGQSVKTLGSVPPCSPSLLVIRLSSIKQLVNQPLLENNCVQCHVAIVDMARFRVRKKTLHFLTMEFCITHCSNDGKELANTVHFFPHT